MHDPAWLEVIKIFYNLENMKRPNITHTLAAWICVSLLLIGVAGASDLFTYQGKLTNAAGVNLPDGQYRLGVRIWDLPAGGTDPLWARKYDVPVQTGVFSLMIGADGIEWNDPAPLTASLKLAVSGSDRFVEITVMSDADQPEKDATQWQTLLPRQQLNAVPFAMNGVPTGTVVPFAGLVVPDGWALCDGSEYLASDPRYAALAQALQGAYGSGEGTFSVPDLKGRTPIGSGKGDTWMPGGTNQSSTWVLGQKFGAERHQMSVAEMPNHSHGVTDPGHRHLRFANLGTGGNRDRHKAGDNSGADQTFTEPAFTGISIQSTGGNAPHNNMQPSLVINYIIKL